MKLFIDFDHKKSGLWKKSFSMISRFNAMGHAGHVANLVPGYLLFSRHIKF